MAHKTLAQSEASHQFHPPPLDESTIKIPHAQPTIFQKKEIVKERKMRMQHGQKCYQRLPAEWAKERFGMSAVPEKSKMSLIWNDASLNERESNRRHNKIRKTGPRNNELDRAIYNWVCDMRNSRKCVSGAMIR